MDESYPPQTYKQESSDIPLEAGSMEKKMKSRSKSHTTKMKKKTSRFNDEHAVPTPSKEGMSSFADISPHQAVLRQSERRSNKSKKRTKSLSKSYACEGNYVGINMDDDTKEKQNPFPSTKETVGSNNHLVSPTNTSMCASNPVAKAISAASPKGSGSRLADSGMESRSITSRSDDDSWFGSPRGMNLAFSPGEGPPNDFSSRFEPSLRPIGSDLSGGEGKDEETSKSQSVIDNPMRMSYMQSPTQLHSLETTDNLGVAASSQDVDLDLEQSRQAAQPDVLVRYLQSMGTSFRTSVDIATRFREQCTAPEVQTETPLTLMSMTAPNVSKPLAPQRSSFANEVVKRDRIATRSEAGVAMSGVAPVGRNHEQGDRSQSRRAQLPFFWERSIQPGAVQMEGRAFGAPPRPRVQQRPPDDELLVEETVEAFEATALEEVENGPVAFAESTPLSWRDLLKEKSLRRRFFILCAAVIAVTITAISLSLTLIKKSSEKEGLVPLTIAPSAAPSSSPTLIDDDILTYTAQLSGIEAVSTPGTPQHSAVGWLSTFDTYSEGFSEFFSQRYAMATLYFSLGGENWLDQDDWMAPDLHECEWSTAVSCVLDGAGEDDRLLVSGIDLSRNGLSGRIPPEIGLLTQLGLLRLSKNQIQGSLPSELFSLSVLGVLDLHKNELTGAIPTNIGTEKDLVHLDLSYNQFAGSIPDGFTNLDLVRVADFSSNQFSGAIPSNLARLKVISTFSLASNMFTGTIPEFTIDDLPGFDSINLGDNMLSGTMPDWTLALLTRQELLFYSNVLTGSIPDASRNDFLLSLLLVDPDIVSKSRLTRMDVSSNDLTGNIPAWGVFMPTVKYIDFSDNKFNGSVPFSSLTSDWASLETALFAQNSLSGTFPIRIPSHVTVLDVSSNHLEGTIPRNLSDSNLELLILDNNKNLSGDIGELLNSAENLNTLSARNTNYTGTMKGTDVLALSNMKEINLASNAITGAIPPEFGSLKSMRMIVLESNMLSGSIPISIGLLPDLRVLSLSNNLLTGSLPQTLGGLSLLENLQLSGNVKLSGSVPQALCSIETLNLTHEAIGCNLDCTCCNDSTDSCKNLSNGTRRDTFNRINLRCI